MKKVYFACSIRGGRDDAVLYGQLVEVIKKHAEVLTEIFANQKLTPAGMSKPSTKIWNIDMEWIRQSDVLIAEVTNPSLGVGYEIAKAEELQKPILCLFRPSSGRSLSAMIAGSPSLTVSDYEDIQTAEHAIVAFLENLSE